MFSRSLSIIGALLLVASTLPIAAQVDDDSDDVDSVDAASGNVAPIDIASKRVVAQRIEGAAPRLDGRLDDPIWKRAVPISDFIQKDPVEGAVPSERTEVAFAYDDDALYVGARMYSADPNAIQAIVTRRDDPGTSERIIISLDTYRDRRTAYSFSVTAAGVRIDYYHPEDAEYSREYSFEPVWEARVAIDSGGWSCEMRIPLSQLRFNDLEEQSWGLNIDRYIPTKNEDIYWIPIPKDGNGWSSRFGELAGIRGIRPSRRLELLPYVASGARLTSLNDPADPFNDGRNLKARAGLDIKMGLGSNLTLDATVNPDFGQVEADPAEVNLSDFETFFDERRPFFIEGSQLLEGIGPSYFYSRRIGAAPHGYPSEGDFVDIPSNSTILGAAKLTGRLPSGLSIGGLAAVTQRERARFYRLNSGTFGEEQVEPAEGYGVVRLQQEFGPLASTVGAMGTAVYRDLPSGDPLAAILPRRAITGGADWNLRFEDGEYELSGYVGGSYVAGDPEAILGLQQSSAHYFQRPDADYVEVDSTKRSLSGYTAGLRMERESGEHWLWSLSLSAESPGFELNDAGSLGSADDLELEGSFTYRETVPGALFRNYSITLNSNNAWNYGGAHTVRNAEIVTYGAFPNFWSGSLGVWWTAPTMSDNLTRGGPLMEVPWTVNAYGSINSSFSGSLRWNAGGNYAIDPLGGWSLGAYGGVNLNLGDRVEVSLHPNYYRTLDRQQYVTTISGGRSETYGNRYIFGSIDRTNISAQFRLSYAVTPDISIEAYAEPFSASGTYSRFGELPSPGAPDLRLYGTDGTIVSTAPNGDYMVTDGPYSTFSFPNPNFNVISFRSNLVFRWEWRPGSTFYLVWQQDRFGFDPTGRFARAGDLWESLSAEGDHFLTLKASYWLPID